MLILRTTSIKNLQNKISRQSTYYQILKFNAFFNHFYFLHFGRKIEFLIKRNKIIACINCTYPRVNSIKYFFVRKKIWEGYIQEAKATWSNLTRGKIRGHLAIISHTSIKKVTAKLVQARWDHQRVNQTTPLKTKTLPAVYAPVIAVSTCAAGVNLCWVPHTQKKGPLHLHNGTP